MPDLASATGLPPFVTDMLFGGGAQSAPKSPAELRNSRILTLLHFLFSALVGVYLLSLIRSSVSTYGDAGDGPLPPPAMAQNPFTVFVMGELVLLGGEKVLGKGSASNGGGGGILAGAWKGVQLLRRIARDGGVAVFVIGVGIWWSGGSQG